MRFLPPRALVASGLVAAVLALSGCGAAGERAATAASQGGARCAIVVDATQSVRREGTAQLVDASVPDFLTGCATVYLQPVGANSQAIRCRPESIQLDPGDAANNPTVAEQIRRARVQAAVQRTREMFACARTYTNERAGSDITGALVAVQRDLADRPGQQRLLLLSDLLAKSEALNLYQADVSTQAKRAKLLDRLARKNLVADLSRTAVTVRGFALGVNLPPGKIVSIEQFWRTYFERAGARIVSWR